MVLLSWINLPIVLLLTSLITLFTIYIGHEHAVIIVSSIITIVAILNVIEWFNMTKQDLILAELLIKCYKNKIDYATYKSYYGIRSTISVLSNDKTGLGLVVFSYDEFYGYGIFKSVDSHYGYIECRNNFTSALARVIIKRYEKEQTRIKDNEVDSIWL